MPKSSSTSPIKVIVNAIPLTVPNTGIGRYMHSLYVEILQSAVADMEFHFFDGKRITRELPTPPQSGSSSKLRQLFWKLPRGISTAIRTVVRARQEYRFKRLAKGFDLYHETVGVPFKVPPGVSTVTTVHDLSIFVYPQHHPKERVAFFTRHFPKGLHQAASILTVSQFTADELQRLTDVDAAKVRVTHLGYDASLFFPRSEADIARVRKKYALPDKYFLFVGTGDPRKNFATIPVALTLLGDRAPSLVVAGMAGWEDRDTRSVHAIGHVIDADLAVLYAGATALIFCSSYEGFGLPLVEAMACGCPVITTRKASLGEVAGDAALFVEDPQAPGELAARIDELMNNEALQQELRGKGMARAQAFQWTTTATRTLEVFRNCTRNRGASTPRSEENHPQGTNGSLHKR